MDIYVWLAVVNVAFFIGWIWNRIRIITIEGQVAILEGKAIPIVTGKHKYP